MQSQATRTQDRRTCTRQHASPAADRALSELTAACSTQIPHEMAAARHLQSPQGCPTPPQAQQWQGLVQESRANLVPSPHTP